MAEKKKYGLDIFQVLKAIDLKNKNFYNKLTEEEKKNFQPLVTMRWLSSVSNAKFAPYYLLLTNEYLNVNFWELQNHPELLWKLASACGIGQTMKHDWIPMPKNEKTNKIHQFLLQYYPEANDVELDIILTQYDFTSFKQFLYSTGLPDNEINPIIDAYKKQYNVKTKK